MWLLNALGSSVGKKILMAVTGLFFCSFLVVHLIGNLMIYGGAESFNAYAEHLHSLGIAITIAEILMLVLITIHISTGFYLFFQNKSARPVRYQVNKNGGGRTIGSATMPYTGIFILFFVIAHLVKFHFGKPAGITPYDMIKEAFSNPGVVVFYVTAMLIVALHLSHGFWSAFQTFGLNHDKYNPMIKTSGILFSLITAVGFGFIPIWIAFFN